MSIATTLGNPVDLSALLTLLIGNFGRESTLLGPSMRAITDHEAAVAAYFLSIYSGSALLGLMMHAIVRKTSLDLRFPLLRFDNYWYYLLRGEAAGFGRRPQTDELPSGVYLSAVVEQGDGCYVYWGIVEDFSFDREGQLDRVLITVAHRRPFQADRDAEVGKALKPEPSPVQGDARFYEVRGDYMSIRYADMKTLNLDYSGS